MIRNFLLICLLTVPDAIYPQADALAKLLNDSVMTHGSVSLTIRDAESGKIVFEHNGETSLSQASVMKLVTSAAALELLGPDHTFTTKVGYTGKLAHGILSGNIILMGGGDPSLGSDRFTGHYGNFLDNWANEIMSLGIKKIKGCVVTDDSYFDYQPVPVKWTWEDIGNYYGAGVYGLSLFDNTLKLHYKTGPEGTIPVKGESDPSGTGILFADSLVASGTMDEGYVYLPPYSNIGWITGTIPVFRQDFILKASLPDPPYLAAQLLSNKLKEKGIKILYPPTTVRLNPLLKTAGFIPVTITVSPPLSDIMDVLNHESVNLYAEDLVKELGKMFGGSGSTPAGIEVVRHFIDSLGINTSGMYIEDGSGLSPQDAINTSALTDILFRMKNTGKYFPDYLNSLPEAGKEGTLRNYFTDPVFGTAMRAKSGSMLRVRSYAGYLTGKSGKQLVFSVIINNFSGPASGIISHVEDIFKETILNN